MESESAFAIAMECEHQVSQDDEFYTCWPCTLKMISHDEEVTQRAAQLEAERDMYKQGFDALTTANEKIVKERDEARAALSREEYKRMVAEAKIKELEDSDAHFSRAMSEALNSGDGVYRP